MTDDRNVPVSEPSVEVRVDTHILDLLGLPVFVKGPTDVPKLKRLIYVTSENNPGSTTHIAPGQARASQRGIAGLRTRSHEPLRVNVFDPAEAEPDAPVAPEGEYLVRLRAVRDRMDARLAASARERAANEASESKPTDTV